MDSNSKPLYRVMPQYRNDGTKDVWRDIEALGDFIGPWGEGPVQQTLFRSYYNDSHLFARFDIEDRSVLIHREKDDKLEVARADRVEIFFKTDASQKRYF